MDKKKVLMASGILVLLYNILVFVIPFQRTNIFWIAYLFIMASIAIVIGVFWNALGKHRILTEIIYRSPQLRASILYMILQMISNSLFMIIAIMPIWSVVSIDIFVLGIFVFYIIVAQTETDVLESVDKQVEKKVVYIKDLQYRVENLSKQVVDRVLKEKLRSLSELIQYSDPMSNSNLFELENKIQDYMGKMEEEIQNLEKANWLCDELIKLVLERKQKCLLMK